MPHICKKGVLITCSIHKNGAYAAKEFLPTQMVEERREVKVLVHLVVNKLRKKSKRILKINLNKEIEGVRSSQEAPVTLD